MLIGHETVSFPIYVFTHYEKFITTKELFLLGHLQAQPRCGKKSWEIVAQRMEYASITPINKAIDSMVERGLVIRSSYDVDATPFHQSCYDMWEKAEVQLAKPKQKKVKKAKPEYAIAYRIEKEFPEISVHSVAGLVKNFLKGGTSEQDTFKVFLWSYRFSNSVSGNDFKLREAIVPFIGADVTSDDFKSFIAYLYSFLNHKKPDVELKPFLSTITITNYDKWIGGGSKTEFVDPKKVDLEDW